MDTDLEDDQAEQYVAEVAAALGAAGYTLAERFTEGIDRCDGPCHVIRIDLGGPTADLIWDRLGWKTTVYLFSTSTACDDLSCTLTDQADAPPRMVLMLVRPVLDEARRRWARHEMVLGQVALPLSETVRLDVTVDEVPQPAAQPMRQALNVAVVPALVGTVTDLGAGAGYDDFLTAVAVHAGVALAGVTPPGSCAMQRALSMVLETMAGTVADLGEQATYEDFLADVAEEARDEGEKAAMVAHDAAVGLPGWTCVAPHTGPVMSVEPTAEQLAWSAELVRRAEDLSQQVASSDVTPTVQGFGGGPAEPAVVEITTVDQQCGIHQPQPVTSGTGVERPCRAGRFVGELRTLLRDWSQYTDTALVGLAQELLQFHGWWDDEDDDAAAQRRARFNDGVDEDLLAYDGWSNEPQKRPLTARERDILCRILGDALRTFTRYQGSSGTRLAGLAGGEVRVTVHPGEVEALRTMRFVLDPRND